MLKVGPTGIEEEEEYDDDDDDRATNSRIVSE
jgi:hypothetical protein